MSKGSSRLTNDTTAAIVLVGPFYAVFLVFLLYPLFSIIYYSLTEFDLFTTARFVGLRNFVRLAQDEIFLRSVWNTVVYAAGTTIPALVAGFAVAVALNDQKIPGLPALRVMFYLPYIPSMVSMAVVWMWFYDPTTGIFNEILKAVGLAPRTWLSDPSFAMPSLIVVGIWQRIGYNMIIYLAALQTIPAYLYESADIDGAGPLRKTFSITIPMVQHTTFYLVVVSLIRTFSVFGQVNIMTNGGPLNTTTTIVHQIYTRGLNDFRFGYANAMTLVLLIVVGGITFANFRFGRQAHEAE